MEIVWSGYSWIFWEPRCCIWWRYIPLPRYASLDQRTLILAYLSWHWCLAWPFWVQHGPTHSCRACSRRRSLVWPAEAESNDVGAIETLFLISKPFCLVVDLVATHSFVSTRYVMQLNLNNKEIKTNYRISLPNDSRVSCPTSYKLIPVTIGG